MGVRLTDPGATVGSPERIPYFTLGVADVSPLEMAEAYATFGARGLHCDVASGARHPRRRRNVIRDFRKQCEQVMEQSTADAVNDILRGVIEGGFASAEALRCRRPARPAPRAARPAPLGGVHGLHPGARAAAMIAGANEPVRPIFLEGLTIDGNYISSVSGSGFAAPMWGAR